MEAVELREEELAIAVVLGACGGLRACARVGGGVAASVCVGLPRSQESTW